MLNGKKIVVVLPAYNAEATLSSTYREIPFDIVDHVLLVDDKSIDETVSIAAELSIETILHPKNRGYGANQKTCYRAALERGADIVVMLHPDYQYTPKLLTALVSMLAYDTYDVALGSRILGKGALEGGMPRYKYVANRVLTLIQNILVSQKLSEYHTGYRAYTRKALEAIDFDRNSDDFVFDNEILVQLHYHGFRIGEISCPTRYAAGSSSISFARSIRYGFGVLAVSLKYVLQRHCGFSFRIFGDRTENRVLPPPQG